MAIILKFGRTLNGKSVLATFSPADRTFSNNRKKFQRTTQLASGRTVSDFIATIHEISVDFKKLGYNRWHFAEVQEVISAPLDGSEVNLVDWTLGNLTAPSNVSYWYPGLYASEQSLFILAQTDNLVLNSGFENNTTTYQDVFHEDFRRIVPSTFTTPAPSYLGSAQFTNGAPSLIVTGNSFIAPATVDTLPPSDAYVEFFIKPSASFLTSSYGLFTTTGATSTKDRLRVSSENGIVTGALWDHNGTLDSWHGSSLVANSWNHVGVLYDSTGFRRLFVNGTAGTHASPASWTSQTSFGSSFALGQDLANLKTSIPTASYGNFRITLNQPSYADSNQNPLAYVAPTISGGSYSYPGGVPSYIWVPTAELPHLDPKGFPSIFKPSASWAQAAKLPGMGWNLRPKGANDPNLASWLYAGADHLHFASNSTIGQIEIIDGASYWQDSSYTFPWSYTGNGSSDVVRLGIHANESYTAGSWSSTEAVYLDISYGTAQFLSTYPVDPADTPHTWRPNLLRDGDFEQSGTYAWNDGGYFDQFIRADDVTLEKSTAYTHSVGYALHVKRDALSSQTYYAQQSIPCKPGETYVVSGWYYAISGNVRIYITSNPSTNDVILPTMTSYGLWTQVTYSFTTVGHHLELTLDVAPGGEAYFDDFEVRQVPSSASFIQRNWFPDGSLDAPYYATVGAPWVQFIQAHALYQPQTNGDGGSYTLKLANNSPLQGNFTESVYYLPSGVYTGYFNAQWSAGSHNFNGNVTAYPSGNASSFSYTFPDSSLHVISFGPVSYLSTDNYMVFTLKMPANTSWILNTVHLNSSTDNGSFRARVVTEGPSYTATIDNGLDTKTWTYIAASQHEGKVSILGQGSWLSDLVTVSQVLDTWKPLLPSTSYPGVIPSSPGSYGSGYVSLATPGYDASECLYIGSSVDVITEVSQPLTTPLSSATLTFAAKLESSGSYHVGLPTPDYTLSTSGASYNLSVGAWSFLSISYITTTPSAFKAGTLGKGGVFVDRFQLENNSYQLAYFDTGTTNVRNPVSLSYDLSYFDPNQGTIAIYVSPKTFASADSPSWTLFDLYQSSTNYARVTSPANSSTLRIEDSVNGVLFTTASYSLGIGTWVHLAIAWDSSGTRFYRNGQLTNTSPLVWNVPSNGAFSIGSPASSNGYLGWFNGLAQRLYAFDRALQPFEIQRLVLFSDSEGLSILELAALADSDTDTYLYSETNSRGTTSYTVLMSEFPVTNISGLQRFADVSLKLTEK